MDKTFDDIKQDIEAVKHTYETEITRLKAIIDVQDQLIKIKDNHIDTLTTGLKKYVNLDNAWR